MELKKMLISFSDPSVLKLLQATEGLYRNTEALSPTELNDMSLIDRGLERFQVQSLPPLFILFKPNRDMNDGRIVELKLIRIWLLKVSLDNPDNPDSETIISQAFSGQPLRQSHDRCASIYIYMLVLFDDVLVGDEVDCIKSVKTLWVL